MCERLRIPARVIGREVLYTEATSCEIATL